MDTIERIIDRMFRFADIYIEHAKKFAPLDKNDPWWNGYHTGQIHMANHLKRVLYEEQGIKAKECPKCGRVLPESAFGECPENEDGRTYYCNDCRAKFGDHKPVKK